MLIFQSFSIDNQARATGSLKYRNATASISLDVLDIWVLHTEKENMAGSVAGQGFRMYMRVKD
jgi:hypothetical protein